MLHSSLGCSWNFTDLLVSVAAPQRRFVRLHCSCRPQRTAEAVASIRMTILDRALLPITLRATLTAGKFPEAAVRLPLGNEQCGRTQQC